MIKRLMRMLAPAAPARHAPSDELRGAPAIRRLKTYRAESGFTWSYHYEGYLQETTPKPAQAFVFTLQGGSGPAGRVFVVIPESTLASACERTGVAVTSRETYALAKMHLFSVLDREEPPEPESRWELDSGAALAIWEQLDL